MFDLFSAFWKLPPWSCVCASILENYLFGPFLCRCWLRSTNWFCIYVFRKASTKQQSRAGGVMPHWWWLSRTPRRSSCTCPCSPRVCHRTLATAATSIGLESGCPCVAACLPTKAIGSLRKEFALLFHSLVNGYVSILQVHPLSNESQHDRMTSRCHVRPRNCNRVVAHVGAAFQFFF